MKNKRKLIDRFSADLKRRDVLKRTAAATAATDAMLAAPAIVGCG